MGSLVPGNPVTATKVGSYIPISPPVPVATGARMAAKTADSVGASAWLVWLNVIAQTDVIDDGVAESPMSPSLPAQPPQALPVMSESTGPPSMLRLRRRA